MTPHSAVAEHAVVDVGRPGQVAGREGHVLHRLDQRHDVVPRDVDVLDGLVEQFLLGGHSLHGSYEGK